MKVLLAGGGSGGHIMPLLAVVHALKQQDPTTHVIYVGQRGDKLADIPANDPSVDEVCNVSAGKLRRYSGEGWGQLLNIRTQLLNVRDVFRTLAGIWQSYQMLGRMHPDVIFTRGGFVSVPVAIAGKLRGIPYITHDSDSTPSLANRLIARWASLHAVALPKELYPYPPEKTIVVGVPISAEYELVTPVIRKKYRGDLELLAEVPVLLVTGGGNGARVLNEAVVSNARYLLGTYPQLVIMHVAGRALETETKKAYDALELGEARSRVVVKGFVVDLYRYSGAADIVIARGGATNLAEFAAQGIACLIIPSKQLGWNVKNASVLAERDAIVQLTEDQVEQPERLGRALGELFEHPELRMQLGVAIHTYAHDDAAGELARYITQLADKGKYATQKK